MHTHTPNSHMQGPLGSARKQGPKGSSNGWLGLPVSYEWPLLPPTGPKRPGQGWHLEDPVLEHKASLRGLGGVSSGQSCSALAAQLGCGEVRELRCWVLDWSPFILSNRVGMAQRSETRLRPSHTPLLLFHPCCQLQPLKLPQATGSLKEHHFPH